MVAKREDESESKMWPQIVRMVFGIKKKMKKNTHRDTKPIYAAATEGYQKASNRTLKWIETNEHVPKKKHTQQDNCNSSSSSAKLERVLKSSECSTATRSPSSSSSSSLWFFSAFCLHLSKNQERKISKYLLCATQMHWAQRATWNYFQVDPFFLALRFAWILCFTVKQQQRQQQQQSKQKIRLFWQV